MISKREMRQLSASMELGQRHPYLFGLGLPALTVLTLLGGAVAAGLWGWIFAREATLAVLRGLGAIALMSGAGWLFWFVALRRRRGSMNWRDYS